MIGYGICIGTQEKFDNFAKVGLGRVITDDSVVAESSDNSSIFTAYNEMLDHFATVDGLEALVLLHEDVEFRDNRVPEIIRETFADPKVAIFGAVGAVGVQSLAWWEGQGRGRARETRGLIDFGGGNHAVDMVDGLLLVLSPWAVKNLRFDEKTFSGFHAYDADICFQARAAGKQVVVREVNLHHHTKGGYGKWKDYSQADEAFRRKWASTLGVEAPEAPAPIEIDETCMVCDSPLAFNAARGIYSVLDCTNCGIGVINPSPSRVIESAGIWEEQYGGSRLGMRPQWLKEAQLRLDWIHHFVSQGTLLEVGGGTGEFVAVASQNGWNAFGAEPSDWAAKQAQELGANVLSADLDGWIDQNPETQVDLVTAFHVVEHIHEPRGVLRSMQKVLRPGGYVVVEVPNYGSEMAEKAPFEWIATALTDHVFHYTPKALRSLFEQEGFVVEQVLEFTPRVYQSAIAWQDTVNETTSFGCKEPSKDMLRIVARMP